MTTIVHLPTAIKEYRHAEQAEKGTPHYNRIRRARERLEADFNANAKEWRVYE